MRRRKTAAAAIALVFLLAAMLGSCGKKDVAPEPVVTVEPAAPAETVAPAETAAPTEAAEPAEPETGTGRQDGERFEEIIIIEGMEETVSYEHVRNDALGVELDYDYTLFQRHSGSDRECFVSIYDDSENPENYLEVTGNPRDADSVAAAVSAALSNDYEIIVESYQLRSGSCIRIDASAGKGGTGTPDLLQTVYIIPAADGCRVAAAHYSFESAEGFGRRFAYMMNAISTLAVREENRMSDEQALAAVKRYCCIENPELEDMADSEDYSVYWEVSASEEQEIVVLFRSYTGAQVNYHIDPASGETYAAEYVPGVTAEEQRTDESFNAWDYWF